MLRIDSNICKIGNMQHATLMALDDIILACMLHTQITFSTSPLQVSSVQYICLGECAFKMSTASADAMSYRFMDIERAYVKAIWPRITICVYVYSATAAKPWCKGTVGMRLRSSALRNAARWVRSRNTRQRA